MAFLQRRPVDTCSRSGDQPVAATMAIDTRIPGRSTHSLLTHPGGRTSGKNSSKTWPVHCKHSTLNHVFKCYIAARLRACEGR